MSKKIMVSALSVMALCVLENNAAEQTDNKSARGDSDLFVVVSTKIQKAKQNALMPAQRERRHAFQQAIQKVCELTPEEEAQFSLYDTASRLTPNLLEQEVPTQISARTQRTDLSHLTSEQKQEHMRMLQRVRYRKPEVKEKKCEYRRLYNQRHEVKKRHAERQRELYYEKRRLKAERTAALERQREPNRPGINDVEKEDEGMASDDSGFNSPYNNHNNDNGSAGGASGMSVY